MSELPAEAVRRAAEHGGVEWPRARRAVRAFLAECPTSFLLSVVADREGGADKLVEKISDYLVGSLDWDSALSDDELAFYGRGLLRALGFQVDD